MYLPTPYKAFRTLYNFIAKSLVCIIVIMCTVIVAIATRCPVSHCRLTKQCRALITTINYYVLMSLFTGRAL